MNDICINGAGPVGAALAARLASLGWSVMIVDTRDLPDAADPSLDGRSYAITEGSRRMLEAAGVWAHLGARPQPIGDIRVIDGGGRAPQVMRFATEDRPEEGVPFGWLVEASDLRVALNAALRAHSGITICAPDQAQFTFGADGVRVSLASGAVHDVRLAIAAEGRRSPLRDQAGIPVTRMAYRQSGLVAIVGHERPHHDTALELFLPQGPFARLPLRGTAEHPHRSAIVWAEGQSRAQRFYDLPDRVFAAEIEKRLEVEARFSETVGAVTPAGRRWIYPLSAQYAHAYVGQRLALVGDSAHGVHPIAGQGLNLGFKDVTALADLLGTPDGQDPGDAGLLRRYQRATRPGNLAVLMATDGLERLFGNDNPVLRLARGAGLAALGRSPSLRRGFVRRAMGL